MDNLNPPLNASARLARAARRYVQRWAYAHLHASAIEVSLFGSRAGWEPERWAAAMTARGIEEARAKRCLARSGALKRVADARLAAGA